MSKSKAIISIIIIIIVLNNSGCNKYENLPVKAVNSEMKMVKSNDQVEDFLNKIKDNLSPNKKIVCYNITPDFIAENSSYRIFVYGVRSFLMFDNEIYELGRFPIFRVHSMALADLDKDCNYELYYSFDWGSGICRSQIGYFNPATKKIVIFDYENLSKSMLLITNEAGELLVNDGNSSVDETVKTDKIIGNIVRKGKTIELHITKNKD